MYLETEFNIGDIVYYTVENGAYSYIGLALIKGVCVIAEDYKNSEYYYVLSVKNCPKQHVFINDKDVFRTNEEAISDLKNKLTSYSEEKIKEIIKRASTPLICI